MLWKIAKAGNDPAIDFAAQELYRCLNSMDPNADVAILTYPSYRESVSSALWLRVSPELAESVQDPALDDAFSVRVENGAGHICGSNPRSVLFGVYCFLKKLGCSWIRPGTDGEYIPQRSTEGITVHAEESASYRHRGICIEGAASYEHVRDMIDWMPKQYYNAYFNQFYIPVTFYNRWYGHKGNPLLESQPMTDEEVEGIRDQTIAEMKKRGLLYHAAGHGWTCEPFGLPGGTFDTVDMEVPASTTRYLAKINGKRGLFRNKPLFTNLCYSNPTVRRRMAHAVVQRCAEVPEIDYMQVWLADGTNNQCECEKCRKMRPADWYIMLLNEIDQLLTQKRLNTRIVFLMYVDLLWEPQHMTLNNPDRFVMMFAPITRTYSASIADAPLFDEEKLPPYERNHLRFPSSVGENLACIRRWRRGFDGDSFDFDYHYMWDHFLDPGYYQMAYTLFRDMQALHGVGLNGMMSCQNQRVFLPTGLGMTAMAAALWNENADFDTVAADYFRCAFGSDGSVMQQYMQDLSEAFDPVYLRGEKPAVNPDAAARLSRVPEILDRMSPLITARAADTSLPASIHATWNYLHYHSEICRLLAIAFWHKAEGRFDRATEALDEVLDYTCRHELDIHHVFDVQLFRRSMERSFHKGMQPVKAQVSTT